MFPRLFLLTLLGCSVIFIPSAKADAPISFVTPWSYQYQNNNSAKTAADTPRSKTGRRSYADNLDRLPPAYTEEHRAAAAQQNNALPVAFREKEQAPSSALEKMYASRIVFALEQFGYDMFGVPGPETRSRLENLAATPTMPMGAVQDDFVLNTGDELDITFTGQRTDRALYRVDSRGMIMIEDFPPIPAAGRSIGQVRISIQAAADNLYNTQAHVALSAVRQINVLVIGHVKKPGRQSLSVFHSVLDALMDAGGVQKTGSLRQIKLVRDGRSTLIDLYALLMHGATNMDLQLRDGDRIIVPAIGPTVAVAGEVKRPGVFEILPAMSGMLHQPENRSEKLSLNEMLELGGGTLSPGSNRMLLMDVTPNGQERVEEVHKAFSAQFGDGAILMVSKGTAQRAGSIELSGHTRRPGLHALDENPTLAKILNSDKILGSDIYPLIGVIERWDNDQLAKTLIDFPVRLVLKGDYDRKLQNGDVVHLFSNTQIKNLGRDITRNNIESEQGSVDEDENPDHIADSAIASFLRERSAFTRGAVRNPGPYPLAEGATLDSLLAVAGGLTLEANTANIEVTSKLQGEGLQSGGRSGTQRVQINFRETRPEDIQLGPGDAINVPQKFHKVADNSVLIIGEVSSPGRYDLLPGDKMSDLLARAGGLTRQSYADGAILSRESERRAEEARFKAQSRSMKQAVAMAMEKDDQEINEGKIAAALALAEELEEAQGVGRLTVEADPAILATQPELDMLLESGDRIYIPKRSLSVRVSGEVLSAANLQFREGKKPLDYIHEAGGFTFHADKERTFVLYPDGSAQPLQVSSWNYNPVFIPPGSTIVVPRDPKPFDFVESAKDVSQILSNLAITAIFIDDVRDD